jgi:beta-lactamase regulating signal transducer with metallopeptidase domain
MNSFAEMLADSWFVLGLVKSTILAAAGGTFLLWIRQRNLAARLWACLALLMPLAFFSGILPFAWEALPMARRMVTELPQLPVVETDENEGTSPAIPSVSETAGPAQHERMTPPDTKSPARLPEPAISYKPSLPWIWIIGGVITLIPGLSALTASGRLKRFAPSGEILDLWRQVAGERAGVIPVHLSHDIATPGIASILRPEVILPASALQWEKEQLVSVLRHEFHHLRQGDPAVRWLGRIVRAALWFHPAVWWVQSRLVIAQERAADEAVVAAGTPAPDYAGHLLAVASGAHPFPGIAMARQSQVGRRIRMVLSRKGISALRTRMERAAALTGAGLAIPMIAVGFGGPEVERVAVIDDTGFRGPILDRHGVLLATSNPARMPEAMRNRPPVRWYPETETFAHVTGYLVPNENGAPSAAKGVGVEDTPGLAEGKPLKLTLDVRIQRLVAQALAARQLPGGLLVMDPQTGEVLAMASWPSFDPNDLANGVAPDEWQALQDRANQPLLNRVTQPVTPGSFAKLLTALAAAKADKTDRVYHCGPSVKAGAWSIRDWNAERNEDLDLRSALATSCNTYFIPLAWELGGGAMASIGKDFGFGSESDRPWRGKARWPSVETAGHKLTQGDIAITAIGHGWTQLSLVDMGRVMSAVASGQIHRARFSDADPADNPLALADIGIDARELATIRQGLIDVVHSPRGVAKKARLDGATVAGISATGQIGQGKHVASFTGYAPADRPRFVVSAAFFFDQQHPAKDAIPSGSATAGPVVTRVMKTLLEAGIGE